MSGLLVVSHACVLSVNRAVYRLLPEEFDVAVATCRTLHEGGAVIEAQPEEGSSLRLHLLELRGATPRTFRFSGLWKLLEAERPACVLVDYDPATLVAAEAGAWARLRGSSLYCISYDNLDRTLDLQSWRDPRRAAKSLVVAATSRVSRAGLTRVFALSATGVRTLESLGLGGRIARMPLGVDTEAFHPDDDARVRTRRELGLDKPTFAYFGRMVEEKGLDLLIETLGTMQDLEWQLLLDRFQGMATPYESRIEELVASNGLSQRVVRFHATHAEMPKYVNAADIVVVPSRSLPQWREQYGRVAAEALACGKVVVVSDSGSLPDVVGAAGIVVPGPDPAMLATELRRLLGDDSLRSRLGDLAVDRARTELSLRVQAGVLHQELRPRLVRTGR